MRIFGTVFMLWLESRHLGMVQEWWNNVYKISDNSEEFWKDYKPCDYIMGLNIQTNKKQWKIIQKEWDALLDSLQRDMQKDMDNLFR